MKFSRFSTRSAAVFEKKASVSPLPVRREGGSFSAQKEASIPVDLLLAQGLLSRLQHQAAMELRDAFFEAGLSPHWAGSYDPACGCFPSFNPYHDTSAPQDEAYSDWHAALKALNHGMLAEVVESAVCHDIMPAEEKVAFLQVGLNKLVKHYGLADTRCALDENINKAAARQIAGRGGGQSGGRSRLLH